MARAVRLDYFDTFYHVLSRGNDRKDIFCGEADYLKFLDLLAKMVERFKVEVHAYVLMTNHFHLLIRTTQSNLSRALQWLGVSYAVWFNRQHQRSGHLFQGRFKSFLVENDSYFIAMCYYIHGNPVRAGVTKKLLDYRWSSYPAYTNKKYQASWLTTDVILALHEGSRRKFSESQNNYSGEKRSPLDALRYGLYLGSENFSEECIRRTKGDKKKEQPQLKFLLRGRTIADISFKILKQLNEKDPEAVIKSKRRVERPNRDIAIFILSHLGVYTNKEIGEAFGVGYTAITGTIKRGEQYIKKDKRLGNITKNY